MSYIEINKKIEQIRTSGLYSDDQIEAIKYACFRSDFNEDLIINPNIPSSIMLTYCNLSTYQKIDVSKYINENWHSRGFDSEQLYTLIFYDSKGFDIEGITPNMSVEEIKNIINTKTDNKYKKDMLENIDFLPIQQVEILKDLDILTFKFLMRQLQEGYDISTLLRPNTKDFSLEQIKYLFTVYSIGGDLEKIFNPNFSVEQMKQFMSASKESVEFLQTIVEQKNNRKK